MRTIDPATTPDPQDERWMLLGYGFGLGKTTWSEIIDVVADIFPGRDRAFWEADLYESHGLKPCDELPQKFRRE